MTKPAVAISPLKRSHIRSCEAIVAESEPWMTLHERIDFRSFTRDQMGPRAYVCTIGPETAGFILFSPEPVFARGGYLRAIGVSTRFRKQGIGRKLLMFAERTTAKHANNLFLCVSSFNRPAQAFYKSCGYVRAGVLSDLIRQGSAEYIYWKRLKPTSSRSRRP